MCYIIHQLLLCLHGAGGKNMAFHVLRVIEMLMSRLCVVKSLLRNKFEPLCIPNNFSPAPVIFFFSFGLFKLMNTGCLHSMPEILVFSYRQKAQETPSRSHCWQPVKNL